MKNIHDSDSIVRHSVTISKAFLPLHNLIKSDSFTPLLELNPTDSIFSHCTPGSTRQLKIWRKMN